MELRALLPSVKPASQNPPFAAKRLEKQRLKWLVGTGGEKAPVSLLAKRGYRGFMGGTIFVVKSDQRAGITDVERAVGLAVHEAKVAGDFGVDLGD